MRKRKETISDSTLLEKINSKFMADQNKLFYKPLKNKVRIFCTSCNKYEYISKEELKQIRKSQVCPKCWNLITTKKHTSIVDEYGCIYYKGKGYWFEWWFKFGCKPRISAIECLRFQKQSNDVEVRYVQRRMFCWGMTFNQAQKEWRIRKNVANTYRYNMYSLNVDTSENIHFNKKDYYAGILENLQYPERMVKSTQRKLMEDYPLNKAQVAFMLAFDINKIDDLYRNSAYIKKQVPSEYYYDSSTIDKLKLLSLTKPLNIFYLDYLRKNKIGFHEYCDYIDQCKELKFKLDKPKDFEYRHNKLAEIISIKRTEDLNSKIASRYNKLKKRSYKKGNVTIQPFKTNEEIIRCGKVLNNCIAGQYMENYAKGKTNLYHLDVDEKMTIAIEEKNGKLIQAQNKGNKGCPKELKKHINAWISQNFKKKEVKNNGKEIVQTMA